MFDLTEKKRHQLAKSMIGSCMETGDDYDKNKALSICKGIVDDVYKRGERIVSRRSLSAVSRIYVTHKKILHANDYEGVKHLNKKDIRQKILDASNENPDE